MAFSYYKLRGVPKCVSNKHTENLQIIFVLYAFFWVIPRRLKFICRRFGTLRLFHLHMQVGL
jgi:hypothetical protein